MNGGWVKGGDFGGGEKGEGGLPSTPILTIYKKVVNI